eukprot:5308083-Lingulodinium_polyedra.AAC.1
MPVLGCAQSLVLKKKPGTPARATTIAMYKFSVALPLGAQLYRRDHGSANAVGARTVAGLRRGAASVVDS